MALCRGKGVHVWDVEGKRYFDFLSAYSGTSVSQCLFSEDFSFSSPYFRSRQPGPLPPEDRGGAQGAVRRPHSHLEGLLQQRAWRVRGQGDGRRLKNVNFANSILSRVSGVRVQTLWLRPTLTHEHR